MERICAQKISAWLVFLLFLLLCLDVLITPLTPVFAYFHADDPTLMQLDSLIATFDYDFDDGLGNVLTILLSDVWQQPYTAVLSLFLLVCGSCSAVLLIQGLHILANIADGNLFSSQNAICLKRASLCCFIIALAALARTIFTIYSRGPGPALLSYTALFIPLFIMAGLLFLIMSGLFAQAVELKEENDLTI